MLFGSWNSSDIASREDHFFTGRAITDPADTNAAFFLDEADVVLSICREVIEALALAEILGPAW